MTAVYVGRALVLAVIALPAQDLLEVNQMSTSALGFRETVQAVCFTASLQELDFSVRETVPWLDAFECTEHVARPLKSCSPCALTGLALSLCTGKDAYERAQEEEVLEAREALAKADPPFDLLATLVWAHPFCPLPGLWVAWWPQTGGLGLGPGLGEFGFLQKPPKAEGLHFTSYVGCAFSCVRNAAVVCSFMLCFLTAPRSRWFSACWLPLSSLDQLTRLCLPRVEEQLSPAPDLR